MGTDVKRDWIDVAGKLLIPVAIAAFGTLYSFNQERANDRRQNLERDVSYLKLMASANKEEQRLGLTVIAERKKKNDLSDDLRSMLTAMAAGPSDDVTTQAAQQILGIGSTQTEANSATSTSQKIPVYLQYAKQEQVEDADRLKAELETRGFEVKQVQMAGPQRVTFNTYVRFFAASSVSGADTVNSAMLKLGYKSAVQDFSAYTDKPLPFIEIWIGKNQSVLVAKPDHK